MTSSKFGLALVALLAGLSALAVPVSAQEIKQLGTFKSWTAWSGTDANGAMCYISAVPASWTPQEVKGAPVKRSPIHFLIINRKGLGRKTRCRRLSATRSTPPTRM